MAKFLQVSVVLSVFLLLRGITPASAQNAVLNNSTALPGGTGYSNVVMGPTNTYPYASGANENIFIGFDAGRNISTGDNNVFLGYQAGYFTNIGSENTFLGYLTGYGNSSGVRNVFTGYFAGYRNIRGSRNAFTGYESGFNNDSGDENTFTGSHAGYDNTTGGYNVFTGSWAGQNNTTGGYNTFTGPYTGQNNTTGSQNTFLGYGADGTGDSKHNLQRATALGYNAAVAVNDGLVLGNTNVKVGIGTSSPDQRLTIKGNMNFVAYDNSMMLKNQPFLHFNEHESLALGLGSEIPSGAEKILVLGSKETTVQIPGIVNNHLPHSGQFLTVDDRGNLRLSQPRVQVASVADWSDKVFEPGYALRPLGEVEEFVKKNGHLPGVPSATEMVEKGMESAAFNAKLLEKIEELTLYVVELERRLKAVEEN